MLQDAAGRCSQAVAWLQLSLQGNVADGAIPHAGVMQVGLLLELGFEPGDLPFGVILIRYKVDLPLQLRIGLSHACLKQRTSAIWLLR